jgi:CubicO group peptidase (beta-lactamase class C family)
MSYKIKASCLKFSTITVFMLFFQFGFSQSSKIPKEVGINRYEDLDAIVQQNQKSFGNNVVAMMWTDTLVYKREMGDFDSKTPVPVADASKWLTAALVMMFVDEGKISLDDKVSKYLPDFELYAKNYITIRHCLSHYTGIKETGTKGLFGKKKFETLKDEANAFARTEIYANAGEQFRYSDIGPIIAAAVLEIASKKKFDMLIKQKLFNPLGMRKSSFSSLDGSIPDPSSGAQSSADDYIHFLQMLLNDGKYRGVQILSEASVKEMRKMETTPEAIKYTPKTAQGFSYALGSWIVDEPKDNMANVLASPSLYGTWPMVDWCRKYAFIIITKTLSKDEQKNDVYMQMKDAIDEKVHPKCN